jgi:hypothetical protein
MGQDDALKARCSKCQNEMIFVASVPHPKSPQMRRTTFVCYACNQTRSYALTHAMAEAYAAASAPLELPELVVFP